MELHSDVERSLKDYQDTNLGFIALLYISLSHLSVPFAGYLSEHGIKLETLKEKLSFLVNQGIITEVAIVAFLEIIAKLVKRLHLSLNDISMMQFETKESISALLDDMDISMKKATLQSRTSRKPAKRSGEAYYGNMDQDFPEGPEG